MLRIALDAGHHLYDQQAKDPNGNPEWVLNNLVCKKIAEHLELFDCSVKRLDDVNGETSVSITRKAELIKSLNANLFISIHHGNTINSSEWNATTGVSVSVSNVSLASTRNFAELVLNNLKLQMKDFDYSNISVTDTSYVLCNEDDIPRLLIVGPYITNYEENVYAWSKEGQEAFATAVSSAILSYFNPRSISDIAIPINIDSVKGNQEIIQDNTTPTMYVVRKEFSLRNTQKTKTTNLERAKSICDDYAGYKVFDMDGNLKYISEKGKVKISTIKSTKECPVQIGVIGGGLVETETGSVLLNYGTNVFIIESLKDICRIRFTDNGITAYGHINTKFLTF